jgi:hypothetical protein
MAAPAEVTVVDRGFSSRDNLAYLQRAGGHDIAGERMRDAARTPLKRCPAKAATSRSATTGEGGEAGRDPGSAVDHLSQP